jgi:hypothetical protein
MRSLIQLFAFCLLALSPQCALSQDIPNPRLCPEVINEWLGHAQEIRQLGGCGLEPGSSYLSTNRKVQTEICLSNSDDTTESRTADIRDTVSKCRYCRAYTDAAVSAAKDNVLFGCGYIGDRWTTKASDHFNWCMNLRDCKPICVVFFLCHDACLARPALQEIYSDRETSARTQDIAECKIRHPEPASCQSCHSANSNSSRTMRQKLQ